MTIDVLYLCHGRLEFTKKTLATLIENTNWGLVDSFVVYNDSAPDLHETTKFLVEALPDGADFRKTNLRSPVGVMNHFMWRSEAEMFAKIDNDIMVPPDWLDDLLSVMEHDPKLELLGMEAGMSGVRLPEENPECYSYVPSTHIGGVGLMRRSAFEAPRPWPKPNGRFGFTEWQHRYRPVRGWIEPDLRVFELDKIPFNPWFGFTDSYKATEGLQRDWTPYPRGMDAYFEWAELEREEGP